jgi:hypothetical protein
MKTFFNYLRYSNIQIAINVNPFTWGFFFERVKDDAWQPGAFGFHLKLLMIRLSVIFDDGSW